jgi:malate dehydrogenase (oxaloacetate-decarboxylating)
MTQKQNDTKALALHKKLRGKIRIIPALPIKDRATLSLIYTPGVAAVSKFITRPSSYIEQAKLARTHTIKGRMIAVISDGSAVLGLGNIGPYGALPVMEGKAALFKTFADVDAFPLVLTSPPRLRSASVEEYIDFVVDTICAIAPAFGGINLEDFKAPECFAIEARLKERLDIPVMHDDQHGTAIAVLAALINAAKVVKKDFKKLKVVVSGAGAAGTAIAKLLFKAGIKDIIVLDRKGIIDASRGDAHKKELANLTNPRRIEGGLTDALLGADALIGVSGPNLLQAKEVALMAQGAIVFAMANPTPEITPEEALKGGAVVVGTGRSDYPNQINNSLVFPGVFRGALDHKVSKITDDMKLKAAHNLAALVKKPTAQKIVPGAFEKGVVAAVAKAIR